MVSGKCWGSEARTCYRQRIGFHKCECTAGAELEGRELHLRKTYAEMLNFYAILRKASTGYAYNAKMLSRRITFADLVAVGRIDRHRLRNLLKDLPEFAQRPANERVASEYTRHDLMVVAVLCELDRMGLRKDAIAQWVSPIQQALLGPRSVPVPQLFLTFDPFEASLVDEHYYLGAGIVVGLDKVLNLVDSHCTGLDTAREQQRELEFGPASVTRPKFAAGQPRARNHG